MSKSLKEKEEFVDNNFYSIVQLKIVQHDNNNFLLHHAYKHKNWDDDECSHLVDFDFDGFKFLIQRGIISMFNSEDGFYEVSISIEDLMNFGIKIDDLVYLIKEKDKV